MRALLRSRETALERRREVALKYELRGSAQTVREGARLAFVSRSDDLPGGAWLDHHEARVFHVAPEGFDETTIHAPLTHIRHPKQVPGLHAHKNDNHELFGELARALSEAEEVLILGPSTAKLEFIRYVHKHDSSLQEKIVGVETVDHPTDPQIAAYAKHYFKVSERLL